MGFGEGHGALGVLGEVVVGSSLLKITSHSCLFFSTIFNFEAPLYFRTVHQRTPIILTLRHIGHHRYLAHGVDYLGGELQVQGLGRGRRGGIGGLVDIGIGEAAAPGGLRDIGVVLFHYILHFLVIEAVEAYWNLPTISLLQPLLNDPQFTLCLLNFIAVDILGVSEPLFLIFSFILLRF